MQTHSLVINPNPKARFVQNADRVRVHNERVSNPAFQASIDVALLEYQHQLKLETGDAAAGAVIAYYKTCGAWEFVHLLKNLGLVITATPKESDPSTLNFKAQ